MIYTRRFLQESFKENNDVVESLKESFNHQITIAKNLISELKNSGSINDCLRLDNQLLKLADQLTRINLSEALVSTPVMRELSLILQQYYQQLYIEVMSDRELYQVYKSLAKTSLTLGNNKLINNKIKSYEALAINKDYEIFEKVAIIDNKIISLINNFNTNLIQAENSYGFTVDTDQLTELDKNYFNNSKEVTINLGLYSVIMNYCSNEGIRQKAYEMMRSLCSYSNNFDNSDLVKEILQLRDQKAKILNEKNYISWNSKLNLLQDSYKINDLLTKITTTLKPLATTKIASLKDLKSDLKPWDISYYGKVLTKKLFNLANLETYFSLNSAYRGMKYLLKELFNLDIKQHNYVKPYFQQAWLLYQDDKLIGEIMFDLIYRVNKRSGAFMVDYRYYQDGNHPAAFVVANFPKRQDSVNLTLDSKINFNDLRTIMHELGHALHHLLSDHNLPVGIRGTNVDACLVELPSQLFELFLFNLDILGKFMINENESDEVKKKILMNELFLVDLDKYHQVVLSSLDFVLHTNTTQDPATITENHLLSHRLLPSNDNYLDKYLVNRFSHIFNGYAGLYYTYLLSEIYALKVFNLVYDNSLKVMGDRLYEIIFSKGDLLSDYINNNHDNLLLLNSNDLTNFVGTKGYQKLMAK